MTTIETPQGPGHFVSKWRTEGPVDESTLAEWKNEMGWTSWLPLAEAALFLDAPELLDTIDGMLSPAEHAVLGLVRRRWLGDTHLMDSIESALEVTSNPETRDLALEGRLRMERGLARYEAGDSEGAEEDLTWAETRLKSVALASRDHDLSLLNKAAYHMAQGENIMALQVYGDISRNGGHAHETIAISRLGASRIRYALGHLFDAGRHAWNAHKHAILAHQNQMAIEGGSLFIELAMEHIDDDSLPMHVQAENAKPIDLSEERPKLGVKSSDINGVFDWCVQHLQDGYGGPERPDLRAMLSIAHKMDRMEAFEVLMANPEAVEDPMLAAVAQACCNEDDEAARMSWSKRLSTLTLI
ncbi:MAG TPA: hypothetical protein QGI72_03025 [Poseidonia sp.]|nr:hypothetical protein [Poseidonia sp.]